MRVLLKRHFPTTTKIQNTILILVSLLFITGLTFLFFAYIAESVQSSSSINISRYIGTQAVAFIVGLVSLLIVSRFNYFEYARYVFILLFISILLMASLLAFGIEANGAVRWIDLGFVQFQPSEVMKVVVIIYFAFIFSNRKIRENLKDTLLYSSFGLVYIAVAGILQPDFGTMVIILGAIIGMAIIAGLPKRLWQIGIGLGLALIPISFFLLPEYITARFITFYNIYIGELSRLDIRGSAYHALENLEAVRVGGLFGQGLGYVSKSTNLKIPELSTDSIFALVAAEIGFIGSFAIISAFLFLFLLFYYIADLTKDLFGKYLVVGLATLLSAQFLINILVVLGLPATGVPLIFFSRGGSSIVITMITIGIILSVLRQQKISRDIYRKNFIKT